MLRLETETGWWLVTHPDHARLAGAFAELGQRTFLRRAARQRPEGHCAARRWLGGARRRAANYAARQTQRIFRGTGGQIFRVRRNRSWRIIWRCATARYG